MIVREEESQDQALCRACVYRESLCRETFTSWIQAPVACVGLSAKPSMKHLDSRTITGKVIDAMEAEAGVGCWHRTNLVKFAPCSPKGKLRYPTNSEMSMCSDLLRAELAQVSPVVVVALGEMTSSYLQKHLWRAPRNKMPHSNAALLEQQKPILMQVKHPSYISVYKRSTIDQYVREVAQTVASLLQARSVAFSA